jgi:hypothetical protein
MLLTALVYAPTLSLSFGHDQNVFAEIGSLILKGKLPYVDAWDIKPPNIFYVYALAEWLFGQRELAIRIVDFISIVISGGLIFSLTSRNASLERSIGNRIGLLATFLFAVTALSLGLADTAQTESFALPWLIGAALLSFGVQSPSKKIIGGLLLAVAGFFKTTNFIFFFPIVFAFARQKESRWKNILVFTLGCVAGSLAELSVMGAEGYLGEYLAISKSVFLGHASELAGTPVTVFSVLRIIWVYLGAWTIVAFVGSVVLFSGRFEKLFKQNVSGRFALFLLAMLVAGSIGILVQQKGWGYHYVILIPALIPLVAILSYPLLAKLSHAISQTLPLHPYVIGVMLTLLLTIIPVAGARWLHVCYDSYLATTNHPKYLTTLGGHNSMYYPPCTDALAEYLEHHTPPNKTVYILGQEPGAYWKANRLPASRYVYTLLFTSPVMKRANFEELAASLRSHLPAIIAVERFDTLAFSGRATTSEDLLASDRLSGVQQLLNERYGFTDLICDKFLIYSLRPPIKQPLF